MNYLYNEINYHFSSIKCWVFMPQLLANIYTLPCYMYRMNLSKRHISLIGRDSHLWSQHLGSRQKRKKRVSPWPTCSISKTPIKLKGHAVSLWIYAIIYKLKFLSLLGEFFVLNQWKVEPYNLVLKVCLTSLVGTPGKACFGGVWGL